LSWYLIRPDQYIAARGTESEIPVLREYLQKAFSAVVGRSSAAVG